MFICQIFTSDTKEFHFHKRDFDWLIRNFEYSWKRMLRSDLTHGWWRERNVSESTVGYRRCSVLCFYISSHFSFIEFKNLSLLLAKFFLSMLIYKFSPFSYTLVFYRNLQSLFTDRVRNVVITQSPEKDMIVADHINQVNLSCEAEGDPSVSFIWYSKNQTWTISCQLKICRW